MQSTAFNNALALIGRILLSIIFIVSGYGKIKGYDGTVAYMAKAGVPGTLLPLVIAVELFGGLLILIGFQTRLVAIGMAVFCLLAAYLFHFDLASQPQTIQLMKNLAMAGGFLALASGGPGAWSVDGRRA
jgi:putative oxidoreductase